MPWHLRELAWQCFNTVWVESLEVYFAQKSSFFTKCPIKKLGVLCRIWSKPFQRRMIRSVPSVYPFFAQTNGGPQVQKYPKQDAETSLVVPHLPGGRHVYKMPPHPAWYKVSYSQIWTKKGPSRVIQTASPARWWVEWKKKDWEETCTESPFPKATSTSLISFWHRISWSYTGCVVRPTLHYGIKFHKLLAFLNQRNDYIR